MSGTFTEKFELDDEQRQVIVDSVHHEVHEGEMMHAEYYAASVSNNSSIDILLSIGAHEAHTVFSVNAGGAGVIYLYESPTVSGGTAVTVYNMKRSNAALPLTTIKHTPTVTATGSTALVNRYIAGGTSPTTRVGGGVRSGTEWILAPSTNYLLRFTNSSGGTIAVSMAIELYEHS